MRQSGVMIYTIGVGSSVNETELSRIASQPHTRNHQWWRVSNFDSALTDIANAVDRELCRPVLGKITL